MNVDLDIDKRLVRYTSNTNPYMVNVGSRMVPSSGSSRRQIKIGELFFVHTRTGNYTIVHELHDPTIMWVFSNWEIQIQ
jgi:hypothetical protein